MQMRAISPVASEAVPPGAVGSDGSWLAAQALEPNFTLMPQWLEPLVRHQARGQKPQIFQTIADDGRPGGLVALARGRWRWGLPLSHLETVFGGFPISGTPLLNPADPAGAARSAEAARPAAPPPSAWGPWPPVGRRASSRCRRHTFCGCATTCSSMPCGIGLWRIFGLTTRLW
mgnify:CR=1 FL=1